MDLQFSANASPIEVARAIPHNTSLRHLFVHGNLSAPSQQAFARAIQDNYHLQSLELMNGSVHLTEVRFYLRMNALGRAKLLSGGSVSKTEWVDKLISERDNASGLFYLLSRHPLLCDPSQ